MRWRSKSSSLNFTQCVWKRTRNPQSVNGKKTTRTGQRLLCFTSCLTRTYNKATVPSPILTAPPSPWLLCLFLLSKGFLMTNLSGLTSLPISHCGIQLPAHPLMNSPGSKDRADRGEDWWKTQKSTSTPSFTFQDSTPPASSLDGSFPLFFSLPPFNVLCRSHLLTVRTT